MSGVAGYVGRDAAAGRRLLERLAAAQSHRGPAQGTAVGSLAGILQLGAVAASATGPGGARPGTGPLGTGRLDPDRSAADQRGAVELAVALPGALPATDGRYALVLDGALENAVELRAALAAEGHPVPADPAGTPSISTGPTGPTGSGHRPSHQPSHGSATGGRGEPGGRSAARHHSRDARDSAVALAVWRAWGTDGLARCVGSFAMVIVDLHESTLTLVRDELGTRPLYFSQPLDGPAPEPAATAGPGSDPGAADQGPADQGPADPGPADSGPAGSGPAAGRSGAPGGEPGAIAQPGVGAATCPELDPAAVAAEAADDDVEILPSRDRGSGPVWVLAASEIPALLAAARLPACPDQVTVFRYLRDGFGQAGRRTFFAGVKRVLAGEVVTITVDGQVSRRRYGRLRTDLDALDRRTRPADPAARELIAAEVRRAVRDRQRGADALAVDPELARLAGDLPVTPEPAPLDPVALAADLGRLPGVLVEPLPGPGAYTSYRRLCAAGTRADVVLDATGARVLRLAGVASLGVRVRDLWHRRRYPRVLSELLRHPIGVLRWLWSAVVARLNPFLDRRVHPVLNLLSPALVHQFGRPVPAARTGLRSQALDQLPGALEFVDRAAGYAGVALRQPLLDVELLRTLWMLDPVPSPWPAPAGETDQPAPPTVSPPAPPTLRRWLEQLDPVLLELFLSASFGSRGYFNQPQVLLAYRSYRNGSTAVEPAVFWRLASLELWLRYWVDGAASRPGQGDDPAARWGATWIAPAPAKGDYLPNPGRELVTSDGGWARYPLRTELIDAETDLLGLAVDRCADFFAAMPTADAELLGDQPWFLYLGATAVSVSQGRTVPVWQVRPSWVAGLLHRLGAGPGRGWHPAATQLAVEDMGVPRLLGATLVGAVGRLLRRRDWFDLVAGPAAMGVGGPRIDGTYPASVCARLSPLRPSVLAWEISAAVRLSLPRAVADRFGGTVIVAVDGSRRLVLGHDTRRRATQLVTAVLDNPLGHGREQTPLAIVADLRKGSDASWAELNLNTPPAPPAWWPAAVETVTARLDAPISPPIGPPVSSGPPQSERAPAGSYAQLDRKPLNRPPTTVTTSSGAEATAATPAVTRTVTWAATPAVTEAGTWAATPAVTEAGTSDVTASDVTAAATAGALAGADRRAPYSDRGFGGFRWEVAEPRLVVPPWRRADRHRIPG